MGDDQDAVEVGLDGVDGLHQPLPPLRILRAEPLVNEERAQLRAGAAGQQLGDGDAQGEVDPKGLAAGEEIVAARPQLVGDDDVQRLLHSALLHLSLGVQPHAHAPVAHAAQQTIGLGLDLRQRGLDDHGLQAPPPEGLPQLLVDALGLRRLPLRFLLDLPLLGQALAGINTLPRRAQPQPGQPFLFQHLLDPLRRCGQPAGDLGQAAHGGGQFLSPGLVGG